MAFNYNSNFNFPWNPSNPFVPNGYSSTAGNVPPNGTPFINPGHQQPPPGIPLPNFNTDVMYGLPRFSANYPFGINGPYSNNQNQARGTHFSTANWNFGLPQFKACSHTAFFSCCVAILKFCSHTAIFTGCDGDFIFVCFAPDTVLEKPCASILTSDVVFNPFYDDRYW